MAVVSKRPEILWGGGTNKVTSTKCSTGMYFIDTERMRGKDNRGKIGTKNVEPKVSS